MVDAAFKKIKTNPWQVRLKQLGGNFGGIETTTTTTTKKKKKSTLSWNATPNHQPSMLNKPTQVRKIKVVFGNLNLNLDLNFKCLSFKSIDFKYNFKYIDTKGLKFLVDSVKSKSLIF